MNKQETAELFVEIDVLYPKDKMFTSKSEKTIERMIESWQAVLDDIPYWMALKGIRKYAKTNSFAPSIADIRDWSKEYNKTYCDTKGDYKIDENGKRVYIEVY